MADNEDNHEKSQKIGKKVFIQYLSRRFGGLTLYIKKFRQPFPLFFKTESLKVVYDFRNFYI